MVICEIGGETSVMRVVLQELEGGPGGGDCDKGD